MCYKIQFRLAAYAKITLNYDIVYQQIHRFYGVMVSAWDFESGDPSSSLDRTRTSRYLSDLYW